MDYHQNNPSSSLSSRTRTPSKCVLCHNLQKVPEKFLKHVKENMSSNAVLIGPSGDQWQVTTLKKGNDMYMKNGWPQFLTANSVILDEFLLFTYHGGNCFQVQIFSKSGCERLCLKETRQQEAATPSLARTDKSKQRKTAGSSHLHDLKSCQEDLPFCKKGSFSKKFPKPISSIKIESSEACKLAESFTSDNPHWKHLMTKANVEGRLILPIATEFVRKYIPEAVKQIVLWNVEGKFWEVEVFRFGLGKRYGRFTKGWEKFVRDNKLMIGDTCIFELEGENHMTDINVHIFRIICAPN